VCYTLYIPNGKEEKMLEANVSSQVVVKYKDTTYIFKFASGYVADEFAGLMKNVSDIVVLKKSVAKEKVEEHAKLND